jgi:hypothetical protein
MSSIRIIMSILILHKGYKQYVRLHFITIKLINFFETL